MLDGDRPESLGGFLVADEGGERVAKPYRAGDIAKLVNSTIDKT